MISNEMGLQMPGSVIPDWAAWTRVTLVGRDPLALSAIRHLLVRSGAVRLRVLANPPDSEAEAGQPEVIIWVRTRHDGLPDLAGHVSNLCRQYPHLRQMVISDFFPAAMPSGPAPLAGVWQVRGNEKTEMLYRLLNLALTTRRRPGPLLTKKLSRMQWRVLQMRAAGADTNTIAYSCDISQKTVSVYESAIRERFWVANKMEYSWLLRSVELIQKSMPALSRSRYRHGRR